VSAQGRPGSRRSLAVLAASLLSLTGTPRMAPAIDIEWAFDAPRPEAPATERARALTQDALVIDLHADVMLWDRDLTARNQHGHVDFPRMREGGLDAVCISVPTTNLLIAQAVHRRWPPRTWTSHWARFCYQTMGAQRQLGPEAGARLARTAADVRRNKAEGILSVFHGVEGAIAFSGRDLSLVDEAARRGALYVGVTHLFDNAYGGHGGGDQRGLSPLGRRLIERMNRAGLLLDTAHASSQTLRDAVRLSAFPPINSHTGVKAVKDHWRNLSDDDIRVIAGRDGVIGTMFGGMALNAPRPEEIVRHMAHVVELVGDDHVALGSDWDGFIRPAIDASQIAQITDRMLQRGWSEARIRKILGENVLRVWAERDRILTARHQKAGAAF